MRQEIVSVSKAKAKLLTLVRSLEEEGRAYILTKDGEPVGVLLPMDDYDSYLETQEIEKDTALLARLRRALRDEKRGRLWTRNAKGRWVPVKR